MLPKVARIYVRLVLAHLVRSTRPARRFDYIAFTAFVISSLDSLHGMVGTGPMGITQAEGIAKLDARCHAMLQSLHPNTMARLGGLSVRNISALHALADDRKELRTFLKDALGLNPASGLERVLEQGKIISAWEQAGIRVGLENKREAGRINSNLPPQLTGEDVVTLKREVREDAQRGSHDREGAVPL